MSEHRPERPAGPLDRNPPPNVWERGSSNRPSRKPPGWWYYLVMFLTAGLIGLLVAIGLRRKGIWETNPDRAEKISWWVGGIGLMLMVLWFLASLCQV